ncbi:hypothetical protein K8I85_13275 [bacterium]|nr:hypothetical protein [bacterium]
MNVPRVNGIGLTEWPRSFSAGRRRIPAWQRIVAAVVLVLFALAVVTTSVVSVGRYCLTSNGGDTRGLPHR